MTIIGLFLVLLIIGIVVGLLLKYLELDPKVASLIRTLAIIVCVILVVVWLFQVFGIDTGLHLHLR